MLFVESYQAIPTRQSLGDLITIAKEKPVALSFVSAGFGSTHHLAGELLKRNRQRRGRARALSRRFAIHHRAARRSVGKPITPKSKRAATNVVDLMGAPALANSICAHLPSGSVKRKAHTRSPLPRTTR
ncbi:hypothetical protein A5906_33005 [Bradyrhizobium sacchari]|nr:hypothetical protein A5906_33005 [Bradyrhizobium sacchari]